MRPKDYHAAIGSHPMLNAHVPKHTHLSVAPFAASQLLQFFRREDHSDGSGISRTIPSQS